MLKQRKHPKACQTPWCKKQALAGPDFLFCLAHNRKEHAKHQKEHPVVKDDTQPYELVCVNCSMRLLIKLTESRAKLLVKANALPRCSRCQSALVTLDPFDTGQIGSPWAVTVSVGIPSVFV